MKLSEVKSTEETIELIKVYAWLFAVVVVMLVNSTINRKTVNQPVISQ